MDSVAILENLKVKVLIVGEEGSNQSPSPRFLIIEKTRWTNEKPLRIKNDDTSLSNFEKSEKENAGND